MADAGDEDILIVYPLWGEKSGHVWPILRLAVAVDSLAVAAGISRAAQAAGKQIGIRAEFDTGFHPCGWPIAAQSIDAIQQMVAIPGLRWDGILVYPGAYYGVTRPSTNRTLSVKTRPWMHCLSSSIPHRYRIRL